MCHALLTTCPHCTWILSVSYPRCSHALAYGIDPTACPHRMERQYRKGAKCAWCGARRRRNRWAKEGRKPSLREGPSTILGEEREERVVAAKGKGKGKSGLRERKGMDRGWVDREGEGEEEDTDDGDAYVQREEYDESDSGSRSETDVDVDKDGEERCRGLWSVEPMEKTAAKRVLRKVVARKTPTKAPTRREQVRKTPYKLDREARRRQIQRRQQHQQKKKQKPKPKSLKGKQPPQMESPRKRRRSTSLHLTGHPTIPTVNTINLATPAITSTTTIDGENLAQLILQQVTRREKKWR